MASRGQGLGILCFPGYNQAGSGRRGTRQNTPSSGGISGLGTQVALGHSGVQCSRQSSGRSRPLVAHGCILHAHSCILTGSQPRSGWGPGTLGRLFLQSFPGICRSRSWLAHPGRSHGRCTGSWHPQDIRSTGTPSSRGSRPSVPYPSSTPCCSHSWSPARSRAALHSCNPGRSSVGIVGSNQADTPAS